MEDIHTSIRDIRSLVIEYVDEKIATLQEMQRRRDDVYNGVIAEMRRRIAETEETNVQLRQELQDVMQQRDVMAHPGHGGHGEEEDRGDTGGGGILPDTVPITQEVERIKETQDKIKEHNFIWNKSESNHGGWAADWTICSSNKVSSQTSRFELSDEPSDYLQTISEWSFKNHI